jgi:hypothetical protein
MRRALAAALVLLTSAFCATNAAADAACDAARRPWVELATGDKPLPPAIGATLLRDVRAGLTEADVCEARESPQGPPVATLAIAARDDRPHRYSIDVRDAVTMKRVGREVDLASIPEDGRSLALAIAAGELVRATWAELLIRRSSAASPAAPAASSAAAEIEQRMLRATAPVPKIASLRENHLGARGAFELFSSGLVLAGGDVFYRRAIGRFALGVAFSARGGLPVSATHGTVRASALGGQVEAAIDLLRAGRFALAIDADVNVSRVLFQGTPSAGAEGGSFDGVAVIPRAGLAAKLDLASALRLDLRAEGGAAAASVVPLDESTRLAGVRGAAFATTLGLGAVF